MKTVPGVRAGPAGRAAGGRAIAPKNHSFHLSGAGSGYGSALRHFIPHRYRPAALSAFFFFLISDLRVRVCFWEGLPYTATLRIGARARGARRQFIYPNEVLCTAMARQPKMQHEQAIVFLAKRGWVCSSVQPRHGGHLLRLQRRQRQSRHSSRARSVAYGAGAARRQQRHPSKQGVQNFNFTNLLKRLGSVSRKSVEIKKL